MNSRLLYSVAAAVSAVAFNIAFVTSAHAQARAALTRDIDRPSAQPVSGHCGASVPDSFYFSLQCRLYLVPPGKRLIVETVSYEAKVYQGARVATIVFGQGDLPPTMTITADNVFKVQPLVTSDDPRTLRVYSASQALRMYVDENKTLAAGGEWVGTFYGPWQFSFSGYIVDK